LGFIILQKIKKQDGTIIIFFFEVIDLFFLF